MSLEQCVWFFMLTKPFFSLPSRSRRIFEYFISPYSKSWATVENKVNLISLVFKGFVVSVPYTEQNSCSTIQLLAAEFVCPVHVPELLKGNSEVSLLLSSGNTDHHAFRILSSPECSRKQHCLKCWLGWEEVTVYSKFDESSQELLMLRWNSSYLMVFFCC